MDEAYVLDPFPLKAINPMEWHYILATVDVRYQRTQNFVIQMAMM